MDSGFHRNDERPGRSKGYAKGCIERGGIWSQRPGSLRIKSVINWAHSLGCSNWRKVGSVGKEIVVHGEHVAGVEGGQV